jgi:hypothetical protein
MHVLDVEIDDQKRLVLTIESGQVEAACPGCGVLAVGHGTAHRAALGLDGWPGSPC